MSNAVNRKVGMLSDSMPSKQSLQARPKSPIKWPQRRHLESHGSHTLATAGKGQNPTAPKRRDSQHADTLARNLQTTSGQAMKTHRQACRITMPPPSQGRRSAQAQRAAGYRRSCPMEHNLHLTGDIHAVTAANNLRSG